MTAKQPVRTLGIAKHVGESLRRSAKKPAVHYPVLGVYGVMIVLLAVEGVRLVQATLGMPQAHCPDHQTVLPNPWLLAAAAVSLVFGRLSGYLRYDEQWHRLRHAQYARQRKVSEALGIVAFTVFAGAATVALLYEAVGVLRSTIPAASTTVLALQPITQYVRCAIYYDRVSGSGGVITWLLVLAISWLMGHWLWALHLPTDLPPATIDETEQTRHA